MDPRFLEELKNCIAPDHIFEEEPMSRHTTFRVGGPAELLLVPSLEELLPIPALCRQYDIPFTIIGNGSNLLVRDRGIRGVVIKLGANAQEITLHQKEDGTARMELGAGTLLSKAAAYAASEGFSGLEFAAGIPGSVGGALVMNAGAYGGEMKDIAESVMALTLEGTLRELAAEELGLSYRHSVIPDKQYLVVRVRLKLQAKNREEILAQMKELGRNRAAKQPLEYPSAGSTFKRPEGHYAGKLIMDAGLAGYRIGDAQISEKHCGFVINRGNASAEDILKLIQETEEKVYEKFQVRLEPEIRILGE